MANYTSDQLITLIKTKGLIPTSQQTFQPADFLNLLNDEVSIGIVPFVMKIRSEHWVYTLDTAIVAGTAAYPIPTRAIGGKVREISIVDNAGNVYDVPQIQQEELPFYNSGMSSGGYNYQFYFQANNIIIVPTPQTTVGLMRVTYYRRPNALVSSLSAALVTAVNVSTNTVTVSSVPSTFSTSTPLDMINGNPGFEWRAIDLTPTTIVGTALTFSTLPTNLAVGDYLALSGQSPVPQMPVELIPMLTQRTVVKVLEALGDKQGVDIAQAKLIEINAACEHILSPRSDGNPKKLINHYSPLKIISSRGFIRS